MTNSVHTYKLCMCDIQKEQLFWCQKKLRSLWTWWSPVVLSNYRFHIHIDLYYVCIRIGNILAKLYELMGNSVNNEEDIPQLKESVEPFELDKVILVSCTLCCLLNVTCCTGMVFQDGDGVLQKCWTWLKHNMCSYPWTNGTRRHRWNNKIWSFSTCELHKKPHIHVAYNWTSLILCLHAGTKQ